MALSIKYHWFKLSWLILKLYLETDMLRKEIYGEIFFCTDLYKFLFHITIINENSLF
jgi:hypothetical protein